jgi:hypothetical protein
MAPGLFLEACLMDKVHGKKVARLLNADNFALEPRESRLRRAAAHQDLRLEKCRLRNPLALGYGLYRIIDPYANVLIAGDGGFNGGYSLTLDDVEEWLAATE